MKTDILNYRIIIEKEADPKTGRSVYNAQCPTLGLADFGKTIDESLDRISKLIKFHIESLSEERRQVPVEKDSTTVVTSISVNAPANAHYVPA